MYYNSKALRKIKSLISLIKDSCPYILNSSFDENLLKLSSFLHVPLFNGDFKIQTDFHANPEMINALFIRCGLPFTPRSETLKNLDALLVSFGKLIINNPSIEKWGFKAWNPKKKNLGFLGYFDLHEFRQIRNILNSNSLQIEQKASSLLNFLSEVKSKKHHF